MKKIFIGLIVYLISCFSLLAEINVSNYPLGMSNTSLHDRLVLDGFYFSKFLPKEVLAKKYAVTGSVPGDFSNLTESTFIRGKFCNGKLYQLDMTSIYRANQNNLFFGRKELYKYLDSNKAVSSGFKLNKSENSSLVSHTYMIDRNNSGGQIRGEEKITIALTDSTLTQLINGERVPILQVRVSMRNKWFCPD